VDLSKSPAPIATFCGLCRTPYEGHECRTCRQDCEGAKSVTEQSLRSDSEDKRRLTKELEE